MPVEIFEIKEPYCFGLGALQAYLERAVWVPPSPKTIILAIGALSPSDAAGLRYLSGAVALTVAHSRRLVLADVNARLATALRQVGVTERLGRNAVFASIAEAIESVRSESALSGSRPLGERRSPQD